ncbi:MAG: deoxyuridine 5'-triphosphate nucleotidohydrolase [Chloroflexota bacterium]
MGQVLTRQEVLHLIGQSPPLVEGLRDPQAQVQPNGVDLTLRQISTLESGGIISYDNRDRVLPDSSPLPPDSDGALDLKPGCYLVLYNEIVHLPTDIMALGFPRSSLLRCGADIRTAVWDAGYSGRSQSLLFVHNPHGIRLQTDARVLQLVFFRLTGEVTEGYRGLFQNENISQ